MRARLPAVLSCVLSFGVAALAATATEESLEHASTRRTSPIAAPAGPAQSSARFRVRQDGSTRGPLAIGVLRVLESAWTDYTRRLGCQPRGPVTVVLQTTTTFRDTTRAPLWAAGWNDGTIRVPVRGLSATTPELVRVLRHELAHSFVAAAGPRCPIWLHEGIAQWLEGPDSAAREDAALAALARLEHLPRLEQLEGPFVALPEEDAAAAYAASLSAVSHILALHGEAGLRRLLAALPESRSGADALRAALSLDYEELQRGFESHVRHAGGNAATTPASAH